LNGPDLKPCKFNFKFNKRFWQKPEKIFIKNFLKFSKIANFKKFQNFKITLSLILVYFENFILRKYLKLTKNTKYEPNLSFSNVKNSSYSSKKKW